MHYHVVCLGHGKQAQAVPVIWGKAGKDAATLDAFFDEIGPEPAAGIEAVSMDIGPAYAKSVRPQGHASRPGR